VTEQDHIERIKCLFVDSMSSSPEVLAAVNTAVRAFPHSAPLWFLHGKVTMAGAGKDDGEIAALSYERCLQLDPKSAAERGARPLL
jgi:hypothetical protein